MDKDIVIAATGAFAIFVVSQAVVFRIVHPELAVRWVLKLFVLICGALLLGIAFGGFPDWETIALGVGLVYSAMAVLYIFCVFGVIEASITLRLLSLIAHVGRHGLTRSQISGRYNKKRIIKRRIDRFFWSGELVRQHGAYALSRRMSYFMLREYFLRFLRRIYPMS